MPRNVGQHRESFRRNILRRPWLYLMVLPGLVFFVMFRLTPIAGSLIAWKDYSIFKGIWRSPWIGWENFRVMFAYPDFYQIFINTLLIGLYRIVFGFPVPILLALLLNEVRRPFYKRVVQSCLYLPYFLSWVVIAQLFYSILHPSSGIVNVLLGRLFGMKPIFFLGKEDYFRGIVTIQYIWKFAGYQSIVYLAAISGIDPGLYESAAIDGANRFVVITRIILPTILPIIIIMALISIGRFMEIGFDQIYNIMNPLVQAKGDIFDTYIVRVGLHQGRYSHTTAVGVFKSVIGFILIMGSNKLAQRLSGGGFFK